MSKETRNLLQRLGLPENVFDIVDVDLSFFECLPLFIKKETLNQTIIP